MRVLVCGGRDYDDYAHVLTVLDNLHRVRGPITAIIEGGARGADTLARDWAKARLVKCVTVPADWTTHGKAAGPIRNQRMVDEFKPDLVVAFAGGRGTADMIRRAETAGLEVAKCTSHDRG